MPRVTLHFPSLLKVKRGPKGQNSALDARYIQQQQHSKWTWNSNLMAIRLTSQNEHSISVVDGTVVHRSNPINNSTNFQKLILNCECELQWFSACRSASKCHADIQSNTCAASPTPCLETEFQDGRPWPTISIAALSMSVPTHQLIGPWRHSRGTRARIRPVPSTRWRQICTKLQFSPSSTKFFFFFFFFLKSRLNFRPQVGWYQRTGRVQPRGCSVCKRNQVRNRTVDNVETVYQVYN